MNKRDVIVEFAQRREITHAASSEIIEDFLRMVTELLLDGEEVRLPPVGKFWVGSYVKGRRVRFRAGSKLHNLVETEPLD